MNCVRLVVQRLVPLMAVPLLLLWGCHAPAPIVPDTHAAYNAEMHSLEKGDGIRDAVSTVAKELSKPGKSVVDPEGLLTDVEASMRALVYGDAEGYYNFRVGHGAVFIRSFGEGLMDHWNEQKIIQVVPPGGLSDRDYFSLIWSTNAARRIALHRVSAASVQAGRGATIEFGTPRADWPYAGAQFSTSLFSPAAGPLTEETGYRLDNTERSAHVTFGVIFADKSKGAVRFNYFFDEAQRTWIPATIAAGAEDAVYWPWPVF